MTELAQTLDCPNADGVLHPVQAHSRVGVVIRLDQCDHCGGVWFDKLELFQVDEAEARSIDPVDKASLRFPHGSSDKPLCPRCRLQLKVFRDANIPDNIQLLMCDRCEGFWVNHGALAGYAQFRESGHKRADPKLAARYEKLAAEYEKMLQGQSDKQYWQGIEKFGNELGAQRDMLTGLPLNGSPAELERIDRAQDIFFTVMGTAARLLFSWL
jgi:Zn-finger nucleic acid-binding protein